MVVIEDHSTMFTRWAHLVDEPRTTEDHSGEAACLQWYLGRHDITWGQERMGRCEEEAALNAMRLTDSSGEQVRRYVGTVRASTAFQARMRRSVSAWRGRSVCMCV